MSNGTYCVQLCRWWWQQKRGGYSFESILHILAHDPLKNAATSSYTKHSNAFAISWELVHCTQSEWCQFSTKCKLCAVKPFFPLYGPQIQLKDMGNYMTFQVCGMMRCTGGCRCSFLQLNILFLYVVY